MNGTEQPHSGNTQSIADYLAQLLKDRKQLVAFPNIFIHVERLLEQEIAKVRASLFQINGVKKEPLVLPEADGTVTTLTEKVYVPVKEHPDFNFVGRILGPRGMTAKQLEQETGCKIMVRGKGSMRDKKKEDMNRGKPNWEHLTDELHVLLTVEDTENRAQLKLARAVEEVQKLLVPQAEGEDELKKRQLMELAIINGTYRDSSVKAVAAAADDFNFYTDINNFNECVRQADLNNLMKWSSENGMTLNTACDEEWRRVAAVAAAESRLLSPVMPGLAGLAARTPAPQAPLGAPLILSPRGTGLLQAGPPPEHQLIYAPYADYAANYAAALSAATPLLQAATEYANPDAGAMAAKQRRHLGQIREHPYQRAGALS